MQYTVSMPNTKRRYFYAELQCVGWKVELLILECQTGCRQLPDYELQQNARKFIVKSDNTDLTIKILSAYTWQVKLLKKKQTFYI